MKKYNAIRLLSLFVLGASLLGINNAFAATTVTIDTPTTGNSVNDSDLVGWSWDTDATDGTIVFTQTGGSADPNSPHTYTMNAGDLLAAGNPHTITIASLNLDAGFSAGGALVDGAIYDITISSPTDGATSTTSSITYDVTAPSVVLSSTATDPTNTSPIPMTATFSEAVTGFVDTDIIVGNGVVSNFAGGPTIYTFDVIPAGNGLVTVDIASAVATDLAGNDNTAATQFSITFDSTSPTVILSSIKTQLVNTNVFQVTATFSEAVTGFVDTDLSTVNAEVSNFVSVSPTIYTFDITVPNEGSGSVMVPASVAVDASTNSNFASNQIDLVFALTRSSSCSGDCYHPHFGVDQNGRSFYDDGLKINQITYKITNVLHNHPDKVIDLPVGVPVSFTLKASDNYGKSIRHMELALGIPKGDFDKQHASVIIDLDIDFQGKAILSYEGNTSLVKNAKWDLSIDDKTAVWHVVFTPTQHLQHDMFAISAVDEYQYVGTYYVNEGISFKGISQNGVPEFSYLDNRGRMHTLTIVDKTLEDLSVAIDEQGNTWNLEDNLWMKEYKSPENLQTQLDKINREIEALRATDHFDSNAIQGELEPSKTHIYSNYGRGHDPVPNMKNAFVDYILSKPGTVNHSSYRLE